MSQLGTAVDEAEKIKKIGNDAYRKAQYTLAIEAYSKAAKLVPEQPVYLSNLSAAQYEDGRYTDCNTSINTALELLAKDQSVDTQGLWTKLLFRKARLLLQLGDIAGAKKSLIELLDKDSEVQLAKVLATAVDRLLSRPDKEDVELAKKRVSELPRYRYPRNADMEYNVVGHDPANSILAPQYNGRANEPGVATRLRTVIPRSGSAPFEFSGLFAGLGDGRHLFATMIDISRQLKGRAATGPVQIHFTAIDIHPGVVARQLIILFAVEELSHHEMKDHGTNPRTRDLLVMLHYLYLATVMPPTAHRTMLMTMETVSKALAKAIKDNVPMKMSWVYMDVKCAPPVLDILQWWLGEGQSAIRFTEMLQKKKKTHGLVGLVDAEEEKKKRRLALIEEDLATPKNQAYIRQVAADEGISLSEAKKAVREIFLSQDEEDIDIIQNSPLGCIPEAQGFQRFPILAPPPHAFEPPELTSLFNYMRIDMDKIKKNGVRENPPPHEDIDALLEKHWKVNTTFLAPGRTFTHQMDLGYSPFDQVLRMFCSPEVEAISPKHPRSLYEYSAPFFSHAADAIRLEQLASNNNFSLEIVLGDAFAVMDKIWYNSLRREPKFPTSYDRIQLTNVPDYTGGDLSTFTSALPLLKRIPTAYIARNCLLNPPVWGSGTNGPHEVGSNTQVFNYTGLIIPQIPSAFGVKLEGKPSWLGDYQTWTIPTQPTPRLPRLEVERMIYRIFLKAVLPAKFSSFNRPYHPREVLNINALFRLIISLLNMGYPGHYLQETLEAMLENRVVTDVRPHARVPIPLSVLTQKPSHSPLSTAPFVAELETATAIWQPLLQFRICSSNLPALNDLVRYSVIISHKMFPMDHMVMANLKTVMLVIGTQEDIDASIGKLRTQVVGTHNPKTSIQLISSFYWDHHSRIATFLLPRDRGNALLQSKLRIALVDCMFWRIASKISACASMQEVGDVDLWDKDIQIQAPQEWDPADEMGMMEDMMTQSSGPDLLTQFM